jgi:hypothetical protein
MRKLQVSKRFGMVYGSSSPGSLTIFCPSCPQPGINLPPDWELLPHWITRRTITVDGNFHADHIKMRRPDQDIMLTNGQGYMAEEARYKEYLSIAKEPRVVGLHIYCVWNPFDLLTRGLHVGNIEQSTMPILTIEETWMLPELLPAVVQDMDVSFQHQSVICKKAKGESPFA